MLCPRNRPVWLVASPSSCSQGEDQAANPESAAPSPAAGRSVVRHHWCARPVGDVAHPGLAPFRCGVRRGRPVRDGQRLLVATGVHRPGAGDLAAPPRHQRTPASPARCHWARRPRRADGGTGAPDPTGTTSLTTLKPPHPTGFAAAPGSHVGSSKRLLDKNASASAAPAAPHRCPPRW